MNNEKDLKIAIVHDFLYEFGGAEVVLQHLHKMYPKAPIFVLWCDPALKKYFPDAVIIPSFLNKVPKILRKKELLLLLCPIAIEIFDFSKFDLVVSSSSIFAKGVVVRSKATHICYCHTPARFLWDGYASFLQGGEIKHFLKMLLSPFLHWLRIWDRLAADRVDYYVANSEYTQRKIQKFYRKDSVVIYPPVNPQRLMTVDQNITVDIKDYYLIVSRLSAYKRIDLAINAFNKLKKPLVIVGQGKDFNKLRSMSEDNIYFTGFQSEEKLAMWYRNCRALIFCGEEDFGIVMVEAMCFGKPVLAYRGGGALEIVIEGQTGEFFDDLVPEILADGVRRLEKNIVNYDIKQIQQAAQKFSDQMFIKQLDSFIMQKQINCKTEINI